MQHKCRQLYPANRQTSADFYDMAGCLLAVTMPQEHAAYKLAAARLLEARRKDGSQADVHVSANVDRTGHFVQ
jgi:hypothetical protein